MLKIEKTKLDGVLLIEPPTSYSDFRGSYVSTYNEQLYGEAGLPSFVEDDYCASYYGVLRGIHGDQSTYKLCSCPFGRIYHVVVNNDPTSPQHLQWTSFFLSDQNKQQVLIPPKFGNAYLVLSEWALFCYKQSQYYQGASNQFTLRWNDPKIGIYWPIPSPLLSERDANAPLL